MLALCDLLIAAILGVLDGSADCTWLVVNASERSSVNLGVLLVVSKGKLWASELLSKVCESVKAELGDSAGDR